MSDIKERHFKENKLLFFEKHTNTTLFPFGETFTKLFTIFKYQSGFDSCRLYGNLLF